MSSARESVREEKHGFKIFIIGTGTSVVDPDPSIFCMDLDQDPSTNKQKK
jgi:hypothetical protein